MWRKTYSRLSRSATLTPPARRAGRRARFPPAALGPQACYQLTVQPEGPHPLEKRGPGGRKLLPPGVLSPFLFKKGGPSRVGCPPGEGKPRRSVRRRRYRPWGRPQTQRAKPLRGRATPSLVPGPPGRLTPCQGKPPTWQGRAPLCIEKRGPRKPLADPDFPKVKK